MNWYVKVVFGYYLYVFKYYYGCFSMDLFVCSWFFLWLVSDVYLFICFFDYYFYEVFVGFVSKVSFV